jgi:hypothetical protein
MRLLWLYPVEILSELLTENGLSDVLNLLNRRGILHCLSSESNNSSPNSESSSGTPFCCKLISFENWFVESSDDEKLGRFYMESGLSPLVWVLLKLKKLPLMNLKGELNFDESEDDSLCVASLM